MARLSTAVALAAVVTMITHAQEGVRRGTTAASMSGVVVTDETPPQPVRRATVTLTSTALTSTISTLTNDQGQFSFGDLPPGSYSVVAARSGFVTSAFGAQRPARRGRPIAVGPGAVLGDLSLTLWRGAVISGRVVDGRGRAMAAVTVRAVNVRPGSAVYQSLSNNGTSTDVSGRFRIFGLEPGEYYIAASSGASAASSAALTLQDGYVDRILAQLLRRQATPGAGRLPAIEATPPRTVVTTIYYPNATGRDDAQLIRLSPGQETSLDMTWTPVAAAPVTGSVSWSDGRPTAGASVRVTRVTGDGGVSPDGRVSATTSNDGAFELPFLPYGDYRISATAGITRDRPWAVSRFQISDGSAVLIPLRLETGITVRGRVDFEPIGDATPAPLTKTSLALVEGATVIDPRTSLSQVAGGSAIAPDGTFSLPGLQPDAIHRLVMHGLPEGWWPVSPTLGSEDLIDGRTRLSRELGEGSLVVHLSNRPAGLFGVFSGDPSSGLALVVVFPQEADLRASVVRVQAVQPDASGNYRFPNLPPGRYFVGVVIDADPDEWKEAAFLDRLSTTAAPVTLGKGQVLKLDLTARYP